MADSGAVKGGPVSGTAGTGKFDGLTTSDKKPTYGTFGHSDKNGLGKKTSPMPNPNARKQGRP